MILRRQKGMFKEKLLVIVLAILGGIIFSGGLFYLYQRTKVVIPPPTRESPTPTPLPSLQLFLNIDVPQDEEVINKKITPLSGKTKPGATVIVSLEDKELVFSPSLDGSFSANLILLEGVNLIEIMSLTPDGKSVSEKRTVTFSTESF